LNGVVRSTKSSEINEVKPRHLPNSAKEEENERRRPHHWQRRVRANAFQ
jgi:hypothetical protein